MEFATKMWVLCVIRGIDHNQICDKLKIDNAVMAMLRKSEIFPGVALEKRIRCELGWPKESDDLLEMIQRATYKSGADGSPHPAPLPSAEGVTPTASPIGPKPSQLLHNKIGRPRKIRPEDDKIEDDGEVIDLGEVRGVVVA